MHFRICLTFILIAFVFTSGYAQTIHNVDILTLQDKDIVSFPLGGQSLPELKSIEGDTPRIYVDIHSDHKPDIPETIPGTGRLVQQIRTGFRPADNSFRIVVDLFPDNNVVVDQTYYLSEDRFVITISEP
jgi:hypothetical protein